MHLHLHFLNSVKCWLDIIPTTIKGRMPRIYENEILRLQVIFNYSKGRKGQTAKLLLLCGNIYKSYHNCPSVGCLKMFSFPQSDLSPINPIQIEVHFRWRQPQCERSYWQGKWNRKTIQRKCNTPNQFQSFFLRYLRLTKATSLQQPIFFVPAVK